jgi:hypothetical protein
MLDDADIGRFVVSVRPLLGDYLLPSPWQNERALGNLFSLVFQNTRMNRRKSAR